MSLLDPWVLLSLSLASPSWSCFEYKQKEIDGRGTPLAFIKGWRWMYAAASSLWFGWRKSLIATVSKELWFVRACDEERRSAVGSFGGSEIGIYLHPTFYPALLVGCPLILSFFLERVVGKAELMCGLRFYYHFICCCRCCCIHIFTFERVTQECDIHAADCTFTPYCS